MQHRTISLVDQIFEELEKKILTGVYNRGDVFTEVALSEELGVSRTPVREALRRLEQEMLITFTSKGALVIGISKQDILDMYDIRIRIEGMASRLAAKNITEAGKKELVDIVKLQEHYTSIKDADNIKNMDSKFHESVYNHCGSAPLYEILHLLHKKVIKYRQTSVQNIERAFKSVVEHREICDAILSGDGRRAEELTTEHIKNAKLSIENIIGE